MATLIARAPFTLSLTARKEEEEEEEEESTLFFLHPSLPRHSDSLTARRKKRKEGLFLLPHLPWNPSNESGGTSTGMLSVCLPRN